MAGRFHPLRVEGGQTQHPPPWASFWSCWSSACHQMILADGQLYTITMPCTLAPNTSRLGLSWVIASCPARPWPSPSSGGHQDADRIPAVLPRPAEEVSRPGGTKAELRPSRGRAQGNPPTHCCGSQGRDKWRGSPGCRGPVSRLGCPHWV